MDEIIKDQKQMLNYLHKQAEEHVKTREMLIEMNEELEKEMIQKDEMLIKVKKENTILKNKLEVEKGNSDCIENLIKDINALKDTNKETEIQIVKVEKEYEEAKSNLSNLTKDNEDLKEKFYVIKNKRDNVEIFE